MRRKVPAALLILLILAGSAWFLRVVWLPWVSISPEKLLQTRFVSGGAWLDSDCRPLRLFPDDQGDFLCYTPLASHSKNILNAVLTAEDRSFFSHPGLDAAAIMRAAWQNLASRRIVSGASTISQQLIRILKPRKRTWSAKISEALTALYLECRYDKKRILEFYLNAVPMFGNVRGFFLASLLLFKKTPDLLNLAESATLAAVVQSPGRLNPFSGAGNKRLRKRRDWLIREMLNAGHCTAREAELAFSENIPDYRSQLPFKAPHFCDYITAARGAPKGNQRTTISQVMQDMLQSAIKSHLPRLARSGARQVCGMIVEAGNMKIRAMVGSAEFGPIAAGFNNGCIAGRSGGSILKPFLYALALEKGFYPSYVIADTMQPFKTPQGEYLPYNADRRSYGPVTIRNALGNSLNISAVKMLNKIGIRDFFDFLVECQLLQAFTDAAKFYGLGLAIGNPELRMLDVVRAYGIFANEGRLKSLSYQPEDEVTEKQVLSAANAYLIFDILSDPAARLLTFGTPSFFKFRNRWALKTGTSTNYRDCWLVAFNKKFILALWVGNFDGSPTRSLSGATACGPLARNVIDELDRLPDQEFFQMPAGIKKVSVCSVSGQRPGQNCKLTGNDLIFGNENDLPECQFHRATGEVHELPADYARWIQGRSMVNDADPFRLFGNLRIFDAFELMGIGETAGEQIAASGPLVVRDKAYDADWNNIKIVSPHEGDRYILSNVTENFVQFRAIPEKPVTEIVWLVNGREFIRTPPPYEAYWPMREGEFTITAITGGEAAAEISITVER